GYEFQGQTGIPAGLTNVSAIAGGSFHSLALLADGVPFFNTPLLSRSAIIGATAQLRVAASGAKPLSYQWQVNGSNILSATNAFLLLTNVQYAHAGDYRAIAANPFGAATSTV